jgi:hypothetical protein
VLIDGLVGPTEEGTPQGGPLSPLLSNFSVENRTSGPMVTTRPSCAAARRRMCSELRQRDESSCHPDALVRPCFIGFRPLPVLAMEIFTTLFGNLLAFVYHCFDRIVIHG